MQYFGERIESTVPCRACEHGFELNFSLRTLMGDLSPHQNACVTGPDDNGIYTLADGRRFRLPTAADQRRVLGFETEQATTALLESCIVGGEPGSDLETLQTAMATVGPIVDLDLNASCPECGSEQIVRFDIQSYLLQVLAHEKRFLNREIHRIATVYGWGAREILGLSRDDRRTYVRLIEADRTAVRRTR
jgi:hypothetical protein